MYAHQQRPPRSPPSRHVDVAATLDQLRKTRLFVRSSGSWMQALCTTVDRRCKFRLFRPRGGSARSVKVHSLHIVVLGQLFFGCALHSDDIVLLSASCYGLQKLIDICKVYGGTWDIKFNSLKSQLITLGALNYGHCPITLNGALISWINKVKHSAFIFLVIVTDVCRRFRGHFDNIMSALGKCSNELAAVQLLKAYCLPTLTYGCEVWSLTDTDLHRITVAWNNCFRHVFKCCWRESLRPLQFFCHILSLSYVIDQRRLLFWRSLRKSDNTLAYLNQNPFIAIVSKYGIVNYSLDVKAAI